MALVTVIPGFFDTSTELPDLGVDGFEDTFTRPDSSSIGITEGFPRRTWSVWTGSASAVHGIRNNEGYAARADGAGHCLATVDAGTADGTFEVTLGESASVTQLAAAFRATDLDNYIRLTNVQQVDYRLQTVINGTPNAIGQTTGITPAPGDRLRVELNGPSIVCFINDVQVFDLTSSHNVGATRHGFYNNNTGADNSIRDVKFTAA